MSKFREYIKEGLVSFDRKLIQNKAKSLFTLLGDNNTTMGKTKFLDDLYDVLKKHSSLDAK